MTLSPDPVRCRRVKSRFHRRQRQHERVLSDREQRLQPAHPQSRGATLEEGDILARQMVEVIYDGNYWQMVNSSVTPSSIQSGGLIYAEDTARRTPSRLP